MLWFFAEDVWHWWTTYWTSQSPTSGRCDHLSPVWFQDLAIRHKTSKTTLAATARFTSCDRCCNGGCCMFIPVALSSLVCCFGLSGFRWIVLSYFTGNTREDPASPLVHVDVSLFEGLVRSLVSFFSLTSRRRNARNRETNLRVWTRKYQDWCSSSMKLLDTSDNACIMLPSTNQRSIKGDDDV